MVILTGPNACGKSVYLKQVGLIVYLAHLGSYVPAESADIPLITSIHSRIQVLIFHIQIHSIFSKLVLTNWFLRNNRDNT